MNEALPPGEPAEQHAKSSTGEDISRRAALVTLSALGIGSLVFQRALAAQVQNGPTVTAEMVKQAEWVSGLNLSDSDRSKLSQSLAQANTGYAIMRTVSLDNSVQPAMIFNPLTGQAPLPASPRVACTPIASAANAKPSNAEEIAFLPVAELGNLIRTRALSSKDLTKIYLDRLKKFDPHLKCVITLTEKLAYEQADRADKEIAAGKYRGPLHGIPWGAKDLISYPGYPTTWGATPFKSQMLSTKATVAERLDDAGAVLVAKLSLGALAEGDIWFGGMTRNPWNNKQGSSGSSAGSACASVAGLVGFAIGSETLGSIVSPSRRCGNSSLRPTFGRVSRHGCMTLSWTMDKIGPLCRTMEDCALVLGVIHGADGKDFSAVDQPFHWPPKRDIRSLKVGVIDGGATPTPAKVREVLKNLGVEQVPVQLPNSIAVWPLLCILRAEAASAFDDVVRKDIREGLNNWPNTFRQGEFVPAVEYIRANRIRTLLMQQMQELMSKVDLYVGGDDLLITNLTGHPTAVLPNGFRKASELEAPYSITFTGRLFGETDLLAVANAYQQATGHHKKHPKMNFT